MPVSTKNIIGKLVFKGLKERECFTSFQEWEESLVDRSYVEGMDDSSGLVVSQSEPSDDDRGKLWLRRDSSGGVIGLYAFQGGNWERLYNYAPGQIIWMTQNSENIPKGFTLIEVGDATLPSAVVTTLMAQYIPNPLGGYYYFAVRYSAF